MRDVFLDERLHLVGVVVNAIRRERETVTVEPVMIQAEHFRLEIIADLVYQVNLQEWFATDEVPRHTRFGKHLLVREDVVNRRFGHWPLHPLLLVLTHQVAILASQLAILRHNECDTLSNTTLPLFRIFAYEFCRFYLVHYFIVD